MLYEVITCFKAVVGPDVMRLRKSIRGKTADGNPRKQSEDGFQAFLGKIRFVRNKGKRQLHQYRHSYEGKKADTDRFCGFLSAVIFTQNISNKKRSRVDYIAEGCD